MYGKPVRPILVAVSRMLCGTATCHRGAIRTHAFWRQRGPRIRVDGTRAPGSENVSP